MNKNTQILYDRWAELRKESKLDCSSINQTDLRIKDFNLADVNGKWLNYLYEWKELFIRQEQARKKVYREMYEWYRDEYSHRLDKREDMQLFIESDERYLVLNEKVQIIQGIISFCEGVSKNLQQKQWEIKAFIDYVKFMEGQV